MTKLGALPERSIIDAYKHVIDFYLHDGVACARRWPRPPTGPRTAAVQETARIAAYAFAHAKDVAPELITQALQMAADSPMTWRDVIISIWLGGTYE